MSILENTSEFIFLNFKDTITQDAMPGMVNELAINVFSVLR
jgi:hypothetical protein